MNPVDLDQHFHRVAVPCIGFRQARKAVVGHTQQYQYDGHDGAEAQVQFILDTQVFEHGRAPEAGFFRKSAYRTVASGSQSRLRRGTVRMHSEHRRPQIATRSRLC
ncbi:hypothetical protein D3C72_2168610 [compost metagenome]